MARGMSRGVRTALGIKSGTPWWLRKARKPRRVGRHAGHASHATHQMKVQPARRIVTRHGRGYGL